MTTQKRKRRVQYTPCRCKKYNFPHRPAAYCLDDSGDFDLHEYRKWKREYAEWNGGFEAR